MITRLVFVADSVISSTILFIIEQIKIHNELLSRLHLLGSFGFFQFFDFIH